MSLGLYASTADGTLSYTGDGNSGVYIYGAQLSDSASLDPYVLHARSGTILDGLLLPAFRL